MGKFLNVLSSDNKYMEVCVMCKKITLFSLMFFTLFCFSSFATVFNVGNVAEFRDALFDAECNDQDDTINVSPGVYDVSNEPLLYDLCIDDNDSNNSLTIKGTGEVILDAKGINPVMLIFNEREDKSSVISISRITFRNGFAGSMRQRSERNLPNEHTLKSSLLVTPFLMDEIMAGGLYVATLSDISMSNNTFKNNYAEVDSSLPLSLGTSRGLKSSRTVLFADPSPFFAGGALLLSFDNSSANIDKNTFDNNSIHPDIIDTFCSNYACLGSGGLFVMSQGNVRITNSTFKQNSSANPESSFFKGQSFDKSLKSGPLLYDFLYFSNLMSGGGLVLSQSATLQNNRFTQNQGVSGGGATFIPSWDYYYSPLVEGISPNTPKLQSSLSVSRSSLSDSKSSLNGSLPVGYPYALDASGNTFENNISMLGSGGLFLMNTTSSQINANFIGNSFTANESYFPLFFIGGGLGISNFIGVDNVTFTTLVKDNKFQENYSPFGGGLGITNFTPETTAHLSADIINNVFSNNISGYGGGISILQPDFEGSSDLSVNANITNNTFFANVADPQNIIFASSSNADKKSLAVVDSVPPSVGGAVFTSFDNGTLNIYNNIFWKNSADEYKDIFSALSIQESISKSEPFKLNIFNNILSGNIDTSVFGDLDFAGTSGNNFSSDPLFVNEAGNNLHISANSPAKNKGVNNAPAIPAKDFEGDSRTFEGIADIGADEYYFYDVPQIPRLQVSVEDFCNPNGYPVQENVGKVISDDSKINCIGDCSEIYENYDIVTLTAIPEPGYMFAGWETTTYGVNCTNSLVCSFKMNRYTSIKAIFAKIKNAPPLEGFFTSEQPLYVASCENPVGVGVASKGARWIDLNIKIPGFEGKMDIYLGIVLPTDEGLKMFLINSLGGLTLFNGTLIPWKTNTNGAIHEWPFGRVYDAIVPGIKVPAGQYTFYVLLMPESSYFDQGYYLTEGSLILE